VILECGLVHSDEPALSRRSNSMAPLFKVEIPSKTLCSSTALILDKAGACNLIESIANGHLARLETAGSGFARLFWRGEELRIYVFNPSRDLRMDIRMTCEVLLEIINIAGMSSRDILIRLRRA
jgi:hypothetical protein